MTWRPTLRIAARDARRAKARSVLIVAMIGLPVLALGYADVMWRTATANPDEQLARDLGASQAAVSMQAPPDAGLLQGADPRDYRFLTTRDGSGLTPDLADLTLPTGTRMLIERGTTVGVQTRAGVAPLAWTEVDATDPAMAGRWTLLEGRAPTSNDEVMLTPRMLDRTGLTLGESLVLTDPERTYTVVGTVAREGDRGLTSVIAAPGTLIGARDGIPLSETYGASGFLIGPPVSWDDVSVYNEQGAVVTSRAVLDNPPPTTRFDELYGEAFSGGVSDYLIAALILAMVACLAALEVVLLAGAAFAVGARRQAHSLALISASGGERRDLRRVVLGGGLVLGAVAGVLGIIGAVLAAGVTDLVVRRWIPQLDLARFDVRPLELVAVFLLGVGTGVLAAVVPARQASRLDVVAALRGRSGAPPRSRRTPVIGVAMIAVGVVGSVLGAGWVVAEQRASTGGDSYLPVVVLVGSAALVLLGLVVCAGTVVSLVARVAPRLPLAGRLALRDAERHRGRSAPAVAAILAAVSGSVAVMLYVASLDQNDRESYTPGAPAGTASVSLVSWGSDLRGDGDGPIAVDPDVVLAATVSTLPVESSVALTTLAPCDTSCARLTVRIPPQNVCPAWRSEVFFTEEAAAEMAATDPRCATQPNVDYLSIGRFGNGVVVGGPEALGANGDAPPPNARNALESGGAVVANPLLIDGDGMITLVFIPDKGDHVRLRVPAVATPADQMIANVVVSQGAVADLPLDVQPTTLLLRLSGGATTDQEDAARAALTSAVDQGVASTLYVERGYASTYGLGLLALAVAAAVVTLGATGIATGLSLTDARADHATLAAVGAAPRLRRRLAGAQALVLGFLGVVLGIGAGVVPALSIIGATASLRVVWPWPQLAVVLVGVPLLAGAAAYLFTRSRVPMQRRIVA